MPYFFSDENLEIGKIVSPAADEMRHLLLSHRVQVGEKVKLQGLNKKRFLELGVKKRFYHFLKLEHPLTKFIKQNASTSS